MGKKSHTGIFSRFKSMLQRHRLGELMMANGLLSAGELRYALVRQRETGGHLGRVLLSEHLVSRRALYGILAQQYTIRGLVAFATVFIAFSSFASKPARAGSIRDVPAEISLVSTANTAFTPVNAYPALFGTAERRSGSLDAFVKWSGMFNKLESEIHDARFQGTLTAWENGIRPYAGMGLEQMARGVNDFVNEENYVTDQDNWHVSDYWETPVEFFQRGGDCEDFAIAKYVSLRMLGVPEERLRIAIVHDEVKNMPHAILIVYSDHGPLMLDSQIKDVRYTANVDRYRPIFTINRTAWWLHTSPTSTMVASAN
jgi:predicted transglutaminase-like cysteine proteinase